MRKVIDIRRVPDAVHSKNSTKKNAARKKILAAFVTNLAALPRGEERAQVAGAFGGAELAQGLGFDLADAFAGYVELLADFLERVLALAADAEAQADNLLLFRRQGLEDVGGFVAHVGVDDGVDGRTYPAVFDQIAERGFTVAADGGFERHGVTGDGLEVLDLLDGNVHATADFVVGGGAAEL